MISNANVKSTIFDLVGEQHFDKSFAAGARDVRLNTSSCQVYLGLKAGAEIPFMGDLFFTSTRETFDSHALCDLHGESRTYSFYYPKGRPGHDRYAIVASTNARFEDWAAMDAATYAANKHKLEQDTLTALESYCPASAARSSTWRRPRPSPSSSIPTTPGAPPSAPSSKACPIR
ncbi:MAG: hypothetical protein R3F17_00250 [Planctomycetota bacterium]